MVLPINRRQPTRRSGIVERAVPNIAAQMNPAAAGRGFGALAAGFAKFAGKLSEEEEKKRVLQDEIAIAEMAQVVHDNPEAAREALNSGDFGPLVGVQQAGRINFMRYAPLALADSLAASEAAKFNNELQNAGPEIYGPQLRQDYLNKQVKGLPPRAAYKFRETFTKATAKALRERQGAMAKLQETQLTNKFYPILFTGLRDGTINGLTSFNKLIEQFIGASINPVESTLAISAQADQFIGQLSSHQDQEIRTRAEFLLYTPDPNRGGSSVATRLGPGKVGQLQADAQKAWYGNVTKQVNDAILKANVLLEQKGTDPAEVLMWLGAVVERAGASRDHPLVMAQLARIHESIRKKDEKNAASNTNPANAINGGMTATQTKDSFEGLLEREIDPWTDAGWIFKVANSPMHKNQKQQLRNMIVGGGTEDWGKAQLFLATVLKNGQYGINEYLPDDMSRGIYYATLWSNSQDAVVLQQRLKDALKEDQEWDGTYFKVAQQNNIITGNNYDKTSRSAVEQEALTYIWGSNMKEEREALGIKMKWEDMSANLKNVYSRRLLDLAAKAASWTNTIQAGNVGIDKIGEAYLQMIKDDYEVGQYTESGPKWIKRRSPYLVKDDAGTVMKYNKMTEAEAEAYGKALDDAGLEGRLGYSADAVTASDGSVFIMANVGIGLEPFFLKPGVNLSIPKGLAGKMGLNGIFVAGDDPSNPGNVIVKPVGPGESLEFHGTSINLPEDMNKLPLSDDRKDKIGVQYLRWNKEAKGWELRRNFGSTQPMLTKKQRDAAEARANKEVNAAIQKLENRAAERLINNRYWNSENNTLNAPQGYLLKKKVELEEALKTATDFKGKMLMRSHLGEINEALESIDLQTKSIESSRFPGELIAQMVAENHPSTWTKDRLVARQEELFAMNKPLETGPEQKAIALELVRRKNGGTPLHPESIIPDSASGIGFFRANEIPPEQIDEHNKKVRERIVDVLSKGINNGSYNPAVISIASKENSVQDAMEVAENMTRKLGGSQSTQLKGGAMNELMVDVVKFISAREGFREFPYKDPGADQYNIGHGTYLGRKDVQAGLEAAGTTLAEVKKRGITEEEASILTSFVVATHEQYMRKEFKGIALRAHQRIALHSFIYSSRWRNGKPTVMGPSLINAIKSGNHAKAAEIIRGTLKVADPTANIRPGMMARRNYEANMYLGSSRATN